MSEASPRGPMVFVRYRDHFFSGEEAGLVDLCNERVTLGWLAKEFGDWIYINNDIPIEKIGVPNRPGKGTLLRRSCIVEMFLIGRESE